MTFIWTTFEGDELTPAEMETLHLYHTVRMLWNHTVPEEHKMRPFRQWRDVGDWPAARRREAMDALLPELTRRREFKHDLVPEQRAEIIHIQKNLAIYERALADFVKNGGPQIEPTDVEDQWDPFIHQTWLDIDEH